VLLLGGCMHAGWNSEGMAFKYQLF